MTTNHPPRPCVQVIASDPDALTLDIEFTTGTGENRYPYARTRYRYRYTLPDAPTFEGVLSHAETQGRYIGAAFAPAVVLPGAYFNQSVRNVFPFTRLQ